VFISWFTGGEVFRSGCVYKRGRGKIFYFRPGHETVPTYHNPEVQKVLINAANYVRTPKSDSYKYGWVPATVE
jgi:trehalose utilization protein